MEDGFSSDEEIANVLAAARAALVEREAKVAALAAQLSDKSKAYEVLRARYVEIKQELLLLKKRLFVAKAERIDTAQLKLEFENLSKELDSLSGFVPESDEGNNDDKEDPPKRGKKGKTGLEGTPNSCGARPSRRMHRPCRPGDRGSRRGGKGQKSSAQIHYKLGRRPAQYYKVRIERAVYRVQGTGEESSLEALATPPELLSRCLAAPSLLADICTSKFHDGMPLYRQEHNRAYEGLCIDRGTMSRWLEDLGGNFGATVVAAMEHDAKANAFCIATDATGFSIQPGPREKGTPRRS